ncbi:MAG: hypothetical protein OXC61_01265 [Flavobacteriaceae bacterium]|nr:hypothetical protein [Flavobacteriaceae bacterium]
MRLPIGSDQLWTPTLFHHPVFDLLFKLLYPFDPTGFPFFSLDGFPLCCIGLVAPFVLTFFDGMTLPFSPNGGLMNSSFFGHGLIEKSLMNQYFQYVPLSWLSF